ncbi:MAG: efflux RND transporter permease subunit [Victivallaceae bacterium]
MSLSEFSVNRPIFVSMLSCIVLILGGIGLRYLPVDLMPDITFPALTISSEYEDASPEEVEELISRPIESAMSAVPGVKEVTSTSTEGISSVRVSFNWGTNLDEASSDVRDKLDQVLPGLPDEVERPRIRKFDSAAMPIMRIGVATDIDLLDARRILEDQIQYRLERVDGVASTAVGGGYIREIQVLFDVDKARTLNIPLEDVLNKIKLSNVTTPAGNVREGRLEVRVRTPGTFASLDELRDTVIGIDKNGEKIRIRDVATVEDTHAKVTRFVRVNGKPGIMMEIYKQSGANTVDISERVLKEIEKINLDYRKQLELQPLMNSADYIKRSLSGVTDSAVSGGLLAILVLLLFLRNFGSTLVIAVSIPMSIIATFALVYFCGFTFNIMTMGGLALGIGMLVDNSIVVLENITRLHDEGMEPRAAAIQGTNEVTAAIIASTLTTLAVFLPMLFMQEMAGIMFRQFSAVVTFSLGCSLVVAITVVPMLSSRLFRYSDSHRRKGWIKNMLDKCDRAQSELDGFYASLLENVLHNRLFFVLGAILLMAALIFPAYYIGSELMPKTDENEVRVYLETAVGTSAEVVNEVVQSTEELINREVGNDMTGRLTFAGSSSWRADGGHKATYIIRLKSRTQRTRSDEEIAKTLDKKLKNIPGATFRARTGTGMFSRMIGAGSGESIAIDLRGYDFDTAAALAESILKIAVTVPGVTDAKLSRDLGTPEDRLVIDRRKADDLRVSVKEIADTLRTILAGSEAGKFREGGDEYTILVKVKNADLMTLDQVLDLSVRNKDGNRVVLRNLIDYRRVSGPVAIERKNQERILTIGVNIFGRDMGSVVRDINEKLKELPMPYGFSYSFVGDYEDQQDAFIELGIAFVLALVLVYMVMACQFESLRDPLVVMLSVPLAGIGVIVTLILTDTTFNMQSFIGCIMLAGIVVNNAILLVDTANLLRRRDGMKLDEAVREAGRRRLRPIMMTTLTTVLGLLPLALGLGDGGEMQAPLARAVIGGLTSSTLVTLFFIPAVYHAIESFFLKKDLTKENDVLN